MNGIFLYNVEQITRFREFPEVVICDSSKKTNRFHMHMVVLQAVDNMGTTFVAATAFISRGLQNMYFWILSTFVDTVGDIDNTHVIITDGDDELGSAIRGVMHRMRHQLCYLHVREEVKRLTKGCPLQFFIVQLNVHHILASQTQKLMIL